MMHNASRIRTTHRVDPAYKIGRLDIKGNQFKNISRELLNLQNETAL